MEKMMRIEDAVRLTQEDKAYLAKERKKDCEEKERLLEKTMAAAFAKTKNRNLAIHLTAAAGAGIVAAAPPPVDSWLLRAAETIMVVLLANSYGEKLTKAAFKGVCLSGAAQLVGEAVALTALEAFKAATLGGGYIVKAAVATGLIEAVGHSVVAYYENPESAGAKACKLGVAIGAAADACRVAKLVLPAKEAVAASAGSGEIAFTGSYSPSIHELQEKVNRIQRTINDIIKRGGSNPSQKILSDLADARRQLEDAIRELNWAIAHQ